LPKALNFTRYFDTIEEYFKAIWEDSLEGMIQFATKKAVKILEEKTDGL